MNQDMMLAIYESQELTDTERDYLLSITEAYEDDLAKASAKIGAANALRPVRAASSVAAIGGGGSWLVLNNKLRKAEAELQKKTYLYNTATEQKEKETLKAEISELKTTIADLEKKKKLAKKVGLTGLATNFGTGVVQSGLGASAGKDIVRAGMAAMNDL